MLFLYGLLTGAFIGVIAATFMATLRQEELEAKYQRLLNKSERHIWQ